jgi:hypothetical protein
MWESYSGVESFRWIMASDVSKNRKSFMFGIIRSRFLAVWKEKTLHTEMVTNLRKGQLGKQFPCKHREIFTEQSRVTPLEDFIIFTPFNFLFKMLRYYSDGTGIDPRWCHLRFFPLFLPTKPCALRSTQPLKMSTRVFSWGKGGRCFWLTTYHPCSAENREDPGP